MTLGGCGSLSVAFKPHGGGMDEDLRRWVAGELERAADHLTGVVERLTELDEDTPERDRWITAAESARVLIMIARPA